MNSGGVCPFLDRKSTRLNSSHTVIYTLSLHDALPISFKGIISYDDFNIIQGAVLNIRTICEDEFWRCLPFFRSEEHTSELQSHSDLHSFPTRRSSDLF